MAAQTRFAIDGLVGEPVTGVEPMAAELNKAQAACTACAAITGSACAEEDGDGDEPDGKECQRVNRRMAAAPDYLSTYPDTQSGIANARVTAGK